MNTYIQFCLNRTHLLLKQNFIMFTKNIINQNIGLTIDLCLSQLLSEMFMDNFEKSIVL